jgi:flagellar basal body-associated protein FliL
MKTKEMKQYRNLNVVSLIVLLLIIAMAISNVLYAQPPKGQQGPPPVPNSKQIKKIVASLAREISLDEAQEEKALAIYTENFVDVKKVTGTGRPDRSKMEALKTELEKDVNAILNKEQKEQFIAYLKKQEKQQRRGRPE